MNMKRLPILDNVLAFVWNTLVVYAAYSLCRLTFLAVNHSLYSGTLTWGGALELMGAGLRFDTSAIFYTNALFLLLLLFPLHWKERRGYYRAVRWLYVAVNAACLYTNLIDCVYFQFTGKRTTVSVLQEFSHEGAASMAKIMLEQFAANWYLVLLAAALTWALYRLFRAPRGVAACRKPAYYAVNGAALAAFVPLFVVGMRGGATTSTRPITISNANQYADNPAESGVVLNTPFALIRTLNKRPLVTPSYMTMEEAEAVFSPVHAPADSAAFVPKNVVVLIMESFGKQHFGVYNRSLRGGAYEGFTPFLDSLVARGGALTFEYSYASGRKSIEGMPSVLSSIPNFVEPLFLTPASLDDFSGLARELGEHKGYVSAFFHGAENGSMGFQAFARATGFQRYYGRTEFDADPHYGGERDFDGTWAVWDEEFLQFYCDRMTEMREPFMTAVFTASSHTPYALPARYRGKFPRGRHPIQETVAYSDNALRLFFAKARRQPWFANTLFVITADHTSGHVDPEYRTTLGNFAVPIIFYAPGDSTLRGYDRERVVEQIDIMPTVLGYLHYDRPYIAFGKDILRTPPARSHALHWVNEFDGYEYVEGDFLLQFDQREVTRAYRFRTDPLLRDDVLATLPPDSLAAMERRLKAIVQQYMFRLNNNRLVMKNEP